MFSFLVDFLSQQQLGGYLAAITPLYICHLIIPPVSHYLGHEQYKGGWDMLFYVRPQRYTPSLQNLKNVWNLIHDPSRSSHLLRISRLFISYDNKDLIYCIENISMISYPIYRELGVLGLYMVYFLGGYAGSDGRLYKRRENDDSYSEYFKQVPRPYYGNTNAIISMISCGAVIYLKECYKIGGKNGFRETNIFQFCISYYCAVLSVNVVRLFNKEYRYSRGSIYGMVFGFMAGGISCFIKPG